MYSKKHTKMFGGSVVTVFFQSVFYLEMHQNNIFFILAHQNNMKTPKKY
jgi:hypothetical protein